MVHMAKVRPAIGFVGAGVTGTALACQLWQQGYSVVAVNSRSLSSSERLAARVNGCTVCQTPQQVADMAQAVFITTPDDIISDIANTLTWHPGQILLHCSGVHSIDILEKARKFGANVACLHPLQTFASIEEAISNIAGSTFALEGDEAALDIVREMALTLRGNIIMLRAGDKVLYHASAVMLSNYLVTLMKTAADLWQPLGIRQDQAVKALLPLLKGTVNNIERVGIPGCLTGPIARGDVETVKKHLASLEKMYPACLDTYKMLGSKTVSIALAKGRLSVETAQEIEALLQTYKPSQVYEEMEADLSSADIVAMMNRH
jgi:predicted short-subunit dehydrogenase-like oxidoreductase (DUF2520 family)